MRQGQVTAAPGWRKQHAEKLGKLGSASAPVLVLFLAFLVVYAALPSQQYDYDTLAELDRIRRFDVTASDPGHMLYALIGIPLYQLWLALGGTGDPLRVMQYANAMFGAAAVAVFANALLELGLRWGIALAVSTAVGVSYAFWTHTEDAFFIIPAAFFLIVALLFALKARYSSRVIFPVGAGLGFGLSSLCCQYHLLFLPAVLVASWPGREQLRAWITKSLYIITVASITAGSLWLWQATMCAGVKTPAEFVAWFIGSHGGIESGLWRCENVALVGPTLLAWTATVLPVYEGLRLSELLDGQISLLHLPGQTALALCAATAVYAAAIAVHSQRQKHTVLPSPMWLALGLWLVLPGTAVLWFDRAEVKLWMTPLLALWIGLAALLNYAVAEQRLSRWHRWVAASLLLLLPVLIGLSNLLLAVLPAATTPSTSLAKAHMAQHVLQPNDLVISATFDWTLHLDYLCPECRVINALTLAQEVPTDHRCEVPARLRAAISSTWADGGDVYVRDYLARPDSMLWTDWITPYTCLQSADFSRYRFEPAWTVVDEAVWKLTPLPVSSTAHTTS